MTGITDIVAGSRWKGWRVAMWGTAALLLAAPAIAMQFTTEVDWDAFDFLVMGALLAIACAAVELAARASGNGSYRLAAIVAVGIAFLTVWANLAVGMIGSEDNPYNLLFGGVLGVALLGAMLARFRPGGLALAMVVAGMAQFAVAGFGYSGDPRGGTFSLLFAAPWFLSAALFHNAAGNGASS